MRFFQNPISTKQEMQSLLDSIQSPPPTPAPGMRPTGKLWEMHLEQERLNLKTKLNNIRRIKTSLREADHALKTNFKKASRGRPKSNGNDHDNGAGR